MGRYWFRHKAHHQQGSPSHCACIGETYLCSYSIACNYHGSTHPNCMDGIIVRVLTPGMPKNLTILIIILPYRRSQHEGCITNRQWRRFKQRFDIQFIIQTFGGKNRQGNGTIQFLINVQNEAAEEISCFDL